MRRGGVGCAATRVHGWVCKGCARGRGGMRGGCAKEGCAWCMRARWGVMLRARGGADGGVLGACGHACARVCACARRARRRLRELSFPLPSTDTGGTHHRTRLRGGWHTGTPSVPAFTNPSSYSGPRRQPRRAPSRWARGFCRPAGRGLSYQCLSQKAALRHGRAGEKERGASGWASWPGQAGAGRLGRAGVPRQRCGGPPCRAVVPCPGSAVPVPK